LRGEYHEASAELAGATFANVNVTTGMSSSSLLVEGKSLCAAYITQKFAPEKKGLHCKIFIKVA
jgi:hypothetical protein